MTTLITPKKWVALAAGGIRPILKYIYCDGSRFVATNGHRLHMLEGIKMKPGMYSENIRKTKEDVSEFPNFEKDIPIGKGEPMMAKKIFEGNTKRHSKLYIEVGSAWLDRDYLVDAIIGFEADTEINVFSTDEKSAVKLSQGLLTAVIMPVKA